MILPTHSAGFSTERAGFSTDRASFVALSASSLSCSIFLKVQAFSLAPGSSSGLVGGNTSPWQPPPDP